MSGEVIKGRRISSYLPIVGMIRPYDRRRPMCLPADDGRPSRTAQER
jgi:hypothetical protein